MLHTWNESSFLWINRTASKYFVENSALLAGLNSVYQSYVNINNSLNQKLWIIQMFAFNNYVNCILYKELNRKEMEILPNYSNCLLSGCRKFLT